MPTLKQKWENFPNRSEQWFDRRTLLVEQVLVYIIWMGNSGILNMPESAYMPEFGQRYSSKSITKNVTSWICLNMRETLHA